MSICICRFIHMSMHRCGDMSMLFYRYMTTGRVDICPYVDASVYDKSSRSVDIAMFLRY
jgi:hypothetical protein